MMKQHKTEFSYRFHSFLFLLLLCLATGCKKLVEVSPPPTAITGENAYDADNTAAAVMTGAYSIISDASPFLPNFLWLSNLAGLSADELQLAQGVTDLQFHHFTNTLFAPVPPNTGGGGYELWSQFYYLIFICNSVLEGAGESESLSAGVRQQLLGEARFLRALCYFYLVNLYGDVPIISGIDHEVNRKVGRSPASEVYAFIISDIQESINLLSADYLSADLINPTNERVRPTKWAATALLARTYLYMQDWSNAEAHATTVIDNTTLYELVPLNDVFLANSREAIWQIQPVSDTRNSFSGSIFILPETGPSFFIFTVYLNPLLVDAFEQGDMRAGLGNWINSVAVNSITYYYPFKYKLGMDSPPGSEYDMIFRLAEQYLIRAEARARLNNIVGAQSDLNQIRNRAGLPDVTANDQATLINAIMQERRVELFTESGHRWLDLKRTQAIDSVMTVVTPLKGGVAWQSYQQWYPLPYHDLQTNPGLQQNQGY